MPHLPQVMNTHRRRKHIVKILNRIEEEIANLSHRREHDIEDKSLWRKTEDKFQKKVYDKGDMEFDVRNQTKARMVQRGMVLIRNCKVLLRHLAGNTQHVVNGK